MDYDMSFRADHEADKDPEDELKLSANMGKVYQLIHAYIGRIWMGTDDLHTSLTAELFYILKPYIKDN